MRFAPLVPLTLALVLAACAGQVPHTPVDPQPQPTLSGFDASFDATLKRSMLAESAYRDLDEISDDQSYELPELADSILSLGLSLVGTRYQYGGSSAKSGFDCSGFIGYLFREEAGLELPRSTREMINIDAPLVERDELEPGDLVFFNSNGRGRVSHAGIYLGDDQFIHSASRRSGGVRVDSLDDRYWKRSYIEAKRVLALAPSEASEPHP